MNEGNIHSGHRARLREKADKYSIGSLADHEIVELRLFDALPRVDTNRIAHELIDRFGSVFEVITAEKQELTKTRGVGSKAADALRMTAEITAVSAANEIAKEKISDKCQIEEYCKWRLLMMPVDTVLVICINKKSMISETLTILPNNAGSDNNIFDAIRTLAKKAKTNEVVIAHSHGNHKTKPSAEDIASTAKLCRLLEQNGIMLAAHIITSKLDTEDILPLCIDTKENICQK